MRDHALCKGNWSSDIKALFQSLGYLHIFENLQPCNLDIVKQKLYENYSEIWSNAVSRYPKLRTYRRFKNMFLLENYIKYNLPRPLRSYLAQIRLGILPIKIETGRFINLKPEERLCPLCTDQLVKNEIHFLFECPAYNIFRLHLIRKSYPTFNLDDSYAKLNILMSTFYKDTSIFISESFQKRSQILFHRRWIMSISNLYSFLYTFHKTTLCIFIFKWCDL